MIAFPCAKLNVGLHIGEKRPDGYHQVESLLYPLSCCDALEVVPANDMRIQLSGLAIDGVDAPLMDSKNLVWQAYNLLSAARALPPVHVHLHKGIPAGAGLGGGSSDAAHMLLLLNKCFCLGLTDSQLHAYAVRIGSDVPFFLKGTPQFARGRGEELQEIPSFLAGLHVRVLVPRLRVGTAAAYAAIGQKSLQCTLLAALKKPRSAWQHHMCNDFQPWLFATHPELQGMVDSLRESGAFYTSLSGSGSAVYGLFEALPAFSPPDVWSFTGTL